MYLTRFLCLLLSFLIFTYHFPSLPYFFFPFPLFFLSFFLFFFPSLSLPLPQLSVKIARHEEEVTDSLISHERRMLVVEKGSSGAPRRPNTSEGDVDGSDECSADGLKAKVVSAIIHSSATTLFDYFYSNRILHHLLYTTMTFTLHYHDTYSTLP